MGRPRKSKQEQPQPSSYQKSSLMRMLLLVSEPSIVPNPAFMEYLKPRLYANPVADAYLRGICNALANKFCPVFFASLPPEFKLCLKHQSDKESDSQILPTKGQREKEFVPLQLNSEDKAFFQNGKGVWILISQDKCKYLLQRFY